MKHAHRASSDRSGLLPPASGHRVRGPLAITHVDVVTMESHNVLRDHAVVIEDGRICALAPTAALDVTGLQTLDGSGCYLMPGLADMHTHVTHAGVCGLYLANGVTRLRNMDGKPWHLALSQMLERGTLPGPSLWSTSPLIDGLGEEGVTGYPGSLVLTEAAHASSMVSALVKRGYREIKAYQWLSLEALRALGTAAAQAGVRVAGHCPEGVSFEESIEAGMGCFEHLTGIGTGHLKDGRRLPLLRSTKTRRGSVESLELIAHHLDFGAIQRLAHAMAARSIWNCPTLVVWQQQVQLLDLALEDSDLRYLPASAVREWEQGLRAQFASLPCPAERWLSLARARDVALARVVRILHEEGAPLLLGTDAPNPFVPHGFSIHRELANLVRAGMTPYEALRCGTVEAASFCGEAASSGSISVGKRADMLLLGSNPLLDVEAIRNTLQAVFVNGWHITRADLDSLLSSHLQASDAPPPTLPGFRGHRLPSHPRWRTFREWLTATEVGYGGYSHRRQPDGGWRVIEEWARSGPRGPQRCRSGLWLNRDWTLVRARVLSESDVGLERTDVEWAVGRYRAWVTQPDGHTCTSEMASVPLLPGPRLALSVVPAWCALQDQHGLASALTVNQEALGIVAATAEYVHEPEGEEDSAGDRTWQIRFESTGEATKQVCRLSTGGVLRELRDTVFGAPRILRVA